jgi:hypothetical protein
MSRRRGASSGSVALSETTSSLDEVSNRLHTLAALAQVPNDGPSQSLAFTAAALSP